MFLIKTDIHSEYGYFKNGLRYALGKVPKSAREDWMTQDPPLIEEVKLKDLPSEEELESLDPNEEEPIADPEGDDKDTTYSGKKRKK